jgi:hypothetical protein
MYPEVGTLVHTSLRHTTVCAQHAGLGPALHRQGGPQAGAGHGLTWRPGRNTKNPGPVELLWGVALNTRLDG